MFKINHLKKSFNKGKANEIKAIDNISLDLPDSGFVILLGQSGSGKTTLLNTICGMEKPDSGTIELDSKFINKYKHRVWDEIRNKDIGYIFQNYNLLRDLTVYENIELSLRMLGIEDKEEIDHRISYCLKALGMYKYIHRQVTALSGGQQQRVGIARAIAKKPRVVIADEPTGNLDSKNTMEIMNILKELSKNILVIMVTHDNKIANFYSDRLITIGDGKVLDDISLNNTSLHTLNTACENDIFIKDLLQTKEETNNITIEHYNMHNDTTIPKMKFTLVNRNGVTFLKVDSPESTVKFVNDDSEVNIVDAHYKDMERTTALESDFSFSNFKSPDKTKKVSVVSTKAAFLNSAKKVRRYKWIQKLMLLSLTFVAFFIALSIYTIFSIIFPNLSDYRLYEQNYILAENENKDNTVKIDSVEFYNYYTEDIGANIEFDSFDQSDRKVYVNVHPTPLRIDEINVLYGRVPSSPSEVVIDKFSLTNTLFTKKGDITPTASEAGIVKYDDILNSKITLSNKEFTVVGISDNKSPSLYMDSGKLLESHFYSNVSTNYFDRIGSDINIVEGDLPKEPNQVLFPIIYKSLYKVDIDSFFYDEFYISGFYSTDIEELSYDATLLTSTDLLNTRLFDSSKQLLLYSKDVDKTMSSAKNLDVEVYHLGEKLSMGDRLDIIIEAYSLFIFPLVIFIISLLEVYFLLRSSLLSRVKEIGIFRSLGMPRIDIYKLFVFEILIFTFIFSLSGYVIGTLLFYQIQKTLEFTLFYINPFTFTFGFLTILICNLLFGLFPIIFLTKKSPAQILSKYDA